VHVGLGGRVVGAVVLQVDEARARGVAVKGVAGAAVAGEWKLALGRELAQPEIVVAGKCLPFPVG
jgi:hypothetical protein